MYGYHGCIKQSSKHDKEGPATNLELAWAFGYRTQGGSRNNFCYIGAETDPETQRVAYTTAALGIIYDMKSKEQLFYPGHSEEITCIALHPKGMIVATGDVASNIHIWNATTMTCLCVIRGIISHGVQRLAFSPSGDRLVSVGLDPDHTIALYDCATGDIISSAKGLVSPANVNDIAYSPNGTEIVIVGKNQIKYFKGANTPKRALDNYLGKIGNAGKKQMFFCCAYLNDDVVVGCASGELYRFKSGQCIQIVQAHGIKEPVLCIGYNPKEGVLITGGKDSLVKTWDSTLREVGASLDMSEDLDGDGFPDSGSFDSAVISVHMLHSRVLVGTQSYHAFRSLFLFDLILMTAVIMIMRTTVFFISSIAMYDFVRWNTREIYRQPILKLSSMLYTVDFIHIMSRILFLSQALEEETCLKPISP